MHNVFIFVQIFYLQTIYIYIDIYLKGRYKKEKIK